MLKYLIYCLILLSTVNQTTAQGNTKSLYFPQEQLILKDCLEDPDKNSCLNLYLQRKLHSVLTEEKNIKVLSKSKKDTLAIDAKLVFSSERTIIKEESSIRIYGKKLKKRLYNEIKSLFFHLDITDIKNRKDTPHVSYHNFNYKFFISTSENQIELIKNTKKYNGGIIEKLPVFPGCNSNVNVELRNCFNNKIMQHVRNHFVYPKQALEQWLHGKVNVVFVIDPDGNISNLKIKGPHEILEKEALRIVSLLPRFEPALNNGIPVKIPYSFPITFKIGY